MLYCDEIVMRVRRNGRRAYFRRSPVNAWSVMVNGKRSIFLKEVQEVPCKPPRHGLAWPHEASLAVRNPFSFRDTEDVDRGHPAR